MSILFRIELTRPKTPPPPPLEVSSSVSPLLTSASPPRPTTPRHVQVPLLPLPPPALTSLQSSQSSDPSTEYVPPVSTSVPMQPANVSNIQNVPVHPVDAILSGPSSRPAARPHISYDSDSVPLQALFKSFACTRWADILHSLSQVDQVIAIAQAKHCPELATPSGKLLLNWPYDDGSTTATQSNTLVSLKTAKSYSKMNQPDHAVYTEIQPAQLMSIHLTIDSDISITEDKSVQYFRVDVGSLLMGWAHEDLDIFSIRHYDATGRLLLSPVGQFWLRRVDKRDWPMLKFSNSGGSGTCNWCLEPFIACLLVPQKCFVSRPMTTGTHHGYGLGGLCNFSIDKGLNCIGSGTLNTFIIHRPTGMVYPLASEVLTGTDPESFHEVAIADEIANAGVIGQHRYLWCHTGCPGQFGSGCYRFSMHKSVSTTKTSYAMRCHIRDASLTNRKMIKEWYIIRPPISKWHRVSMLNAEDQSALAIDKTVKWANDIVPVPVPVPDADAVSALA